MPLTRSQTGKTNDFEFYVAVLSAMKTLKKHILKNMSPMLALIAGSSNA